MNTLMWRRRLLYRMHQLGPMGLLGLGFLLSAAVVWLLVIRTGEHELQGLAHKFQVRQVQLTAMNQVGHIVELSKEEKIDLFYKQFPAATRVPDLLKNVYEAAEHAELTLETGEYALLHTESDRLARYRVALPVKGSFAQIIKFMDAVLKDMPTIALESANFKRENIEDAVVSAKLVFIVFVETQP